MKKTVTKIKPVFEDNRGKIFDLLDTKKVKHIGIIESKNGSIRGNHFHRKSTQWTYVIEGKIRVYTKNVSDDKSEVEESILNENDMIVIPPMIIHAVEALEDSKLLVLTDQPRINNGYEYDTFKVKIK